MCTTLIVNTLPNPAPSPPKPRPSRGFSGGSAL